MKCNSTARGVMTMKYFVPDGRLLAGVVGLETSRPGTIGDGEGSCNLKHSMWEIDMDPQIMDPTWSVIWESIYDCSQDIFLWARRLIVVSKERIIYMYTVIFNIVQQYLHLIILVWTLWFPLCCNNTCVCLNSRYCHIWIQWSCSSIWDSSSKCTLR